VASPASATAPSPQQPLPSDIQGPSDDGTSLTVNLGTPSLIVNPQAMPGNNELASKALEKFRSGDYEGAAGLFKELAETDKSAFSAVGMSYFRLGNYQTANEYFEKAIESDSHDFVARKALAFRITNWTTSKKVLSIQAKGFLLSLIPSYRPCLNGSAKKKIPNAILLKKAPHTSKSSLTVMNTER